MGIAANVISFLSLLYPLVFSILVDRVFIEKNVSMLFNVVLMYLGIFGITQLLELVQYRLWAYHYHKYLFNLRKDIFEKIIRLKAIDLNRLSAGECNILLTSDSENCYNTVNWFITDFCMHVIRFVLHFVCLAFINWKLCLIFMVMVPFMAFISQLTKNIIKNYSERSRDLNANFSTHSIEFFHRQKELRLIKGESRFSQILNHLLEKIMNLNVKNSMLSNGLGGIYSIINTVSLMIFFFFSMLFVSQNALSIGLYIAAYYYFGSAIIGLNNLLNAKTSLHWTLVSVDKIMNILKIRDENDMQLANKREIHEVNDLMIKNLSFGYSADKTVLANVNMEIKKGQKIAFIGLSGSGKSTLLNLIAQFYEPTTGMISANNIDISTFSLYQWRHKISYLQQEVMIFEGTIKYNLLLAKPNATDSEIEASCRKANIWEYFCSLPEKLNTVIGKKRELSGGQKQRLGIARSILKEADVLILDESTSALDYETENMILDTIFRLQNITVIMITHRYRNNHRFDRIALLNQGQIIAYDCHDNLLKNCSLYHDVINNINEDW